MLGNLQKRDNSREAGATRELRSNLRQRNLGQLGNFNFSWRQRVTASNAHVRPLPKTHGTRDLTFANPISEGAEELHEPAA